MRNYSGTIIDFYEGAYGRTIRIDVAAKSWLISLRENIVRLLGNDAGNIEIGLIENVQISRISSFTLAKTVKSVNPCIFAEDDDGGLPSISWLQDEEQLITLIELIDSLIDYDKPGHQYLTNDENDIIIVLAYKE